MLLKLCASVSPSTNDLCKHYTTEIHTKTKQCPCRPSRGHEARPFLTLRHSLFLDVAVSLTAHGFSLQTSLLTRERGVGVNNPRICLPLFISRPHSAFLSAAPSSSSAQGYPKSLCPVVIFSALKHVHLDREGRHIRQGNKHTRPRK